VISFTDSARNLVSGNTNTGVQIHGAGTSGNVLKGNFIGTNASGTAAVANGFHGVHISSNASGNVVGGTVAGEGNTIAFNDDDGVAVEGSAAGNAIRGNSIRSNGGLGIDLVGGTENVYGVTANDGGDGDTGPNTGGMGAYTPLSDLSDDEAAGLVATFHRPAMVEMTRRGTPFRGLLYAGLMLTADGPRLLEFNVRFGDPEAQAVLPRLAAPLAPVLLAAAHGTLASAVDGEGPGNSAMHVRDDASVAVVMAASGYPGAPRTGDPIEGIDAARADGALVFHGATALTEGGFVTAGGRVLTVVATGEDLDAARERAYEAAGRIRFAGMQQRRDSSGLYRRRFVQPGVRGGPGLCW